MGGQDGTIALIEPSPTKLQSTQLPVNVVKTPAARAFLHLTAFMVVLPFLGYALAVGAGEKIGRHARDEMIDPFKMLLRETPRF